MRRRAALALRLKLLERRVARAVSAVSARKFFDQGAANFVAYDAVEFAGMHAQLVELRLRPVF